MLYHSEWEFDRISISVSFFSECRDRPSRFLKTACTPLVPVLFEKNRGMGGYLG